jgi:hypothetical protein
VTFNNKFWTRLLIVALGVFAAAVIFGDIWSSLHNGSH